MELTPTGFVDLGSANNNIEQMFGGDLTSL